MKPANVAVLHFCLTPWGARFRMAWAVLCGRTITVADAPPERP